MQQLIMLSKASNRENLKRPALLAASFAPHQVRQAAAAGFSA
jgi:hypothetical protein